MTNVFTLYVVPTLGNILGILMLFSPLKAVLQIRRARKLGVINPLPYPMTAINCLAWVIYGVVITNYFVAPANLLGALFGLFATTTALLATEDKKLGDIIQAMVVIAGAVFGFLAMLHAFAIKEDSQRQRMWGLLCLVVLMIYYVIPLSSMYQVIRTRNAASIYLPLACTAAVNGALWGVYGLAISDWNIWVPNSFGALLGVAQVVLRLVIGVKSEAIGSQETERVPAPVTGAGVVLEPARLCSPEGSTSTDSWPDVKHKGIPMAQLGEATANGALNNGGSPV